MSHTSKTVLVNDAGDYVSKFGGVAESWNEIVEAGMEQDFIVTSSEELERVIRRLTADGFVRLHQTDIPAEH